MSYIRSTSNPESLYIWGDSDGMINICHTVKPPRASRPLTPDTSEWIRVPLKDFHTVCRKWHAGVRDITRGVVRVREAVVPEKGRNEFLVRFSYRRRWFCMWYVTWEYVVHDVMIRERRVSDDVPLDKKRRAPKKSKKRVRSAKVSAR